MKSFSEQRLMMIRLETETIIAAQPDRVWQILTDFKSFPEWNPSILEMEGSPELKARLALKVSAPDRSGTTYAFKAVIVRFLPGELLAWRSGVPGILNGLIRQHIQDDELRTRNNPITASTLPDRGYSTRPYALDKRSHSVFPIRQPSDLV